MFKNGSRHLWFAAVFMLNCCRWNTSNPIWSESSDSLLGREEAVICPTWQRPVTFMPTNNSGSPVHLTCVSFRLCCQIQQAVSTQSFFPMSSQDEKGTICPGRRAVLQFITQGGSIFKAIQQLVLLQSIRRRRQACFAWCVVGSLLLWLHYHFGEVQTGHSFWKWTILGPIFWNILYYKSHLLLNLKVIAGHLLFTFPPLLQFSWWSRFIFR